MRDNLDTKLGSLAEALVAHQQTPHQAYCNITLTALDTLTTHEAERDDWGDF